MTTDIRLNHSRLQGLSQVEGFEVHDKYGKLLDQGINEDIWLSKIDVVLCATQARWT